MLTELKAVLKKPMLWITMVGVALVPALYNIIFLSSMWDPYGKVSDLPVAVVNKDKTATYEGKKMTIGKDMTDNMVHNKSLDYHFVDSEKAQKGLEKGDYYMIITLPEDLSQNAASVLTDEPKKLTIPYQTSKGHSFVASKMSETAAKTLKESVSKNITSSYTKSLFKSMSTLKTGLGSAANASQKIAVGSKQLENGSQVMTDNLNLLSNSSQTFAQGTNTLYSGLTAYTGGVGQLSAGLNNLNNGLTAYTNGVGQLANGSSQLSNQSQKLLGGVAQLGSGSTSIQQLVNASSQLNQGLIKLSTATGLSEEQVQQFSSLINQLGTLNQSIQNYSDNGTATTANSPDLSTYLSAITTAAQAIVNSGNTSTNQQTTTNQSNALAAVQATGAYQRLSAEDQSEIAAALANTGSSTTTTGADANAVSQAQAILNNVQSIQSALSTVQTTTANTPTSPSASLTQIKNTANSVLPSAATSLTTLSSGLTQAKTALDSQVVPVSTALANGTAQLGSTFSTGANSLMTGVGQYTNAVDILNAGANTLAAKNNQITDGTSQLVNGANQLNSNSGQLTKGTAQLANGANQIETGAGKLAAGGESLTAGLTTLSSGSGELSKALSTAKNKLSLVAVDNDNAKTLSSPVTIKHTDKDNVKTNGVGMAPYMMSAALMVMAISTNTIFRAALSGKQAKTLREWIDQKLAVNGLIAVTGAIILYFGVHIIGLSANFELKTLGLIILTSITFMVLVTTLVTWHDKFGSFAALILLLLQLGSSAGTYPLAVTGKFFQVVNPYLPMSYSVSGLRETISMAGIIGNQLLALSLFFLTFAALGLLIARRRIRSIKVA
ncbi:YhgE/Pip domain-containing protein [Streptococcus mutans]|uniref:YhgE/Pip domain-containing protein n=3 Tax=Streptococcus mutans TaxID=1309 RepID=UPI000466C890|nr:YhgE/Pip domain-containing protein [Streptococcus mutans]MCB5107385.1 YhgE/Pip domain-containing protein [Streptococcus mutans]MDB8635806.1 YhgE/Pip domain-containing protein [Streptococcus mutans]MDB8639417.1 YhgE/Pip domain-containing protein [Streptococcus mutans]MDB8641149.1 YhgE/Pip domain-containing protein [Streptococcus mutans]NLQ69382.1 YhgE/Pip domain-containing protein [Streptococcus mutans]